MENSEAEIGQVMQAEPSNTRKQTQHLDQELPKERESNLADQNPLPGTSPEEMLLDGLGTQSHILTAESLRTEMISNRELEEDALDPFAEDWPSEDEFESDAVDFKHPAEQQVTRVQEPADEAKSFLPPAKFPIAAPIRPFIFYENVSRTAASAQESAEIWGIMSRELFGIDFESFDSAAVSVSHRQRNYISNVPKGSRRTVHLSPFHYIRDLFGDLRYWPGWDRRKALGKLHTICTTFPKNLEIRRLNKGAEAAAAAGMDIDTASKETVSQSARVFHQLLASACSVGFQSWRQIRVDTSALFFSFVLSTCPSETKCWAHLIADLEQLRMIKRIDSKVEPLSYSKYASTFAVVRAFLGLGGKESSGSNGISGDGESVGVS
jgi:hypothetical protein